MATVIENRKNGKTVSYKFRAYLGRNEVGKQINRFCFDFFSGLYINGFRFFFTLFSLRGNGRFFAFEMYLLINCVYWILI